MVEAIDDWRREIDAIDQKLLELLNKRAEIAIRIGEIKRTGGMGIDDPDREKEVLAALRKMNKGPLSDMALERVFRVIIEESKRIEKERVGIVRDHG